MTPFILVFAFGFGFIAYRIGLPPLVGYLMAGFTLNYLGFDENQNLESIGELGVTLLLFSIGLKLRLKSLAKPEIWAGASIHMLITVLIFGLGIFGLSLTGLSVFAHLSFKTSLLIAFALSFSSTVFVVKILEERGEMSSLHGRIAIGLLIMQDIFAVVFMTVSEGKLPSPWAAVFLISLLVIRPVILEIMSRVGHRELLLLFGVILALGLGAEGFQAFGIKADLGALIAGILVASHEKASELSDSLLGFKDLFLVGFFLTIGLSGLPALSDVGIAGLFSLAVSFKAVLFFVILTRFNLRPRTSLLNSFSMANYSEFGLMVGAIGVKNGWIDNQWLIILAVTMSFSFVLASPLNTYAHSIYSRYSGLLKRFRTGRTHPDDQPADPGDATIIVFGMSQIGRAAYDQMRLRHGETVVGVDYDAENVKKLKQTGRNIILGDATDCDFWENALSKNNSIKLAMLAMESLCENKYAADQLFSSGYKGMIAAVARFDDEVTELKNVGVHAAFNFYAEAGAGFADHTCNTLEKECAVLETK